jgi:hypothetical protein
LVLLELKGLEEVNKYSSPSSLLVLKIISKKINERMDSAFLSSCSLFRLQLHSKTIRDMIRSMEGFTFASALDLNMGYYHIKLDADAQKLCTIHCIPMIHGKIQIQTLTHGYQDCPRYFSKRHL